MTDEDLERFQRIERNLDFMVQNQARFDARMSQIEDSLAQVTLKHAGLEDIVMRLAESHVELVKSHKELADSERRLNLEMVDLKDRVDAFITFIEKYISSRDSGEGRR
jgi:chromosome segregation ATPase